MARNALNIAVYPGDGIGPEVIGIARAALEALEAGIGGFTLNYDEHAAGAGYYRQSGEEISEASMKAAHTADAILLGAMGLPDVRLPDGREITPHLRMRDELCLFAGVRPVKAYPNTPRRLLDERAANIDFIVLRESTEGLFYSRNFGEVIGDQEARETLRITRPITEKLFDVGFNLARGRKDKGGKGLVTCVDKANVFRAYAFFRKIGFERAALNADIGFATNYVDAQALDLIRRPWDFDVLVMENMFADILSDLGGGLVGGMGMAPCAELGEKHGLFQPAHGSAPDIAGHGKANPTATVLSAAMMLDWLGQRHGNRKLNEASAVLEQAIENGFAARALRPMEFGGDQSSADYAKALIELIAKGMKRC